MDGFDSVFAVIAKQSRRIWEYELLISSFD